MRNINIRKLLLSAFFFAAILSLILGLMSAYTIWLLNGNLRSSSADINKNVETELNSLHTQNKVSEMAEGILAATSSDQLKSLDPAPKLAGLKSEGATVDPDMEANVSTLYKSKLNYVTTRESLDKNLTTFIDRTQMLTTTVTETVNSVRDKEMSDAADKQKEISEKTDKSTRSKLEELNKTASSTLDDTVLVLQLRGRLLELEVSVNGYLRTPSKDKVESIKKSLNDISEMFGKIPENVAGAFEVSEMNTMRGKAEEMLIGKNGIVGQTAISPDSVAKLFDVLSGLDTKLLDLADNTVFDGSNNLSNNLQGVTKDVGSSLGTLIKQQKDGMNSLGKISQLQQSTSMLSDTINNLLFMVQNASLRCTDKCVNLLRANGDTMLASLKQEKESLVTILKDLGKDSAADDINGKVDDLIARASGKSGIIAQTLNAADAYNRSIAANNAINEKLAEATRNSTASFRDFTSKITTAMQDKIVQGGVWMKIQMVFVVFIFVVAITLGIWIGAIVSKRLGEAVVQLFGLSEKLSNSSASLTESSEEQATMASEQAASLEESSSTVEEISSMAERNNEAVNQAAEISTNVLSSTEEGTKKMRNMSRAMDDMSKASAQIGKIIKAIDEIAFQTNILALNAAVEAARAGEAGAGFAVVADEVRSLALKCKNAAHETEDIIVKNTALTQEGVKISASVAESFEQIRTRINELDTLVKEIAQASREQTTGLGQINQALATTSTATQKNAAIAQQGASSAQELTNAAAKLIETIDSLSQLSGLKMEERATRERLAIEEGDGRPERKIALEAPKPETTAKSALPRPSMNGKTTGHFLPQGGTVSKRS